MFHKNFKKLGWVPDFPDHRDKKYSIHRLGSEQLISLPKEVDLRNHMPPVYDQKDTSSCTANGIAALLQYDRMKQGLPNFIPSRLFIYYNERMMEDDTDTDGGAMIRDGVKSVATDGYISEILWPFDETKLLVKPPQQLYKVAKNNIAYEYYSLDNSNIDELKQCLAAGFPFVFGISLYKSFYDADDNFGHVPMPTHDDNLLGGHCLTGDTIIPLLNGDKITLKKLCELYPNKPFYVYSIDENNNVVPGLAHSPRMTDKNREIIGIELDNGQIVKVTPDHKIMMRDGTYKEAGKLIPGESLMPLYRGKSKENYETVYHPGDSKVSLTHRTVAAYMNGGIYNAEVVHHADFNKHNNDPNNLKLMSWDDHTKLHNEFTILLETYAKSEKGRQKSKEMMTSLWANSDWRELRCIQNGINGKKIMEQKKQAGELIGFQNSKIREKAQTNNPYVTDHLRTPEAIKKCVESRKETLKNNIELNQHIKNVAINNIQQYNEKLKSGELQLSEKQINARKNNAKNLSPEVRKLAQMRSSWSRFYKEKFPNYDDYVSYKNHKVVKIHKMGFEDVYDLTVEKHHNFAVEQGIFVHNCITCVGYNDDTNYFVIRNSWGEDCGDKGHYYLPESYICNTDLASDFWTIRRTS